jgi:O-acetylserine/cysteine efflux transporter
MEILAIVAVVVVWGVNNAAAKVATEVMPPLMVGAVRFLIAGLCLWPVFLRPPFPDLRSLLVIVLCGGPLHYGLIYLAFWLAEDVSPVTVSTQLWVPFTALFAWVLLGERVSLAAFGGMAVALAGVVWMTLDPHALQDWDAILVGALASCAWAVTTVFARRATAIPPLKMQALLAAVTLPSLALGSLAFERGQGEAIQAATPLVWVCLVWAGVVSSVLATSLVFWLVQRRPAGRVTPYFLATPGVSMLMGWGLLGDRLTPQILAGAGLTVAGVLLVAAAERNLRAGAAKA